MQKSMDIPRLHTTFKKINSIYESYQFDYLLLDLELN